MKSIVYIFLFISAVSFAQTDYNTKKGVIAKGYDVVAYFNEMAVEGSKKFQTTHDGVIYRFSSQKNLDAFNATPKQYVPQYGGYCAYAIGAKGEKVGINPKTYEIRDGKLYLFYNAWGTNTLELWKNEGAEKLKKQADINWQKIKNK